MKADILLEKIAAPGSDELLSMLYGPESRERSRARIAHLVRATVAAFPETASYLRIFSAPGRTELGGNHTDHNRGKVLAASIHLDAVACVCPRNDLTVRFRSTGYEDVVVDLSDLGVREDEKGKTEALVRGIAAELSARGTKVRGFTANAASTVLSGSGLSSSASIEVLLGAIFDGLYGAGKRSAVELAQIGQKAENVYFGKPCGLMDQVACASGGAVAIDFADAARPEVRRVGFDLAAAGFALCVVDTGGSHEDLTSDYAAIPAEMKSAAEALGKGFLREIDRKTFLAKIADVRAAAGDRAVLRALHFYDENERVDAMAASLERADAAKAAGNDEARNEAVRCFLRTAAESGSSSWRLLQNVFTTEHPAEQGVSLALAMTDLFLKNECGGAGICRVHGGGFAGTIQAYVPIGRVEGYAAWMEPVFGKNAVTPLMIRPVGATELLF